MNIGFHYYITKYLCMEAGFSEEDAQIIAYACQYTDDATYHKLLKIRDMPERTNIRMGPDWLDPTCTSYKGISMFNLAKEGPREKVLKPFHFMPPEGKHIVVQDTSESRLLPELMVKNLKSHPPGDPCRQLHLVSIGIGLHTYQDTFAHAGFSARNSREDNAVYDVNLKHNGRVDILPLWARIKGLLGYHIGHGRLDTFPDRFCTRIMYTNGRGEEQFVLNNNIFMLAAHRTFGILTQDQSTAQQHADIGHKVRSILRRNQSSRRSWARYFKEKLPDIPFYYDEKEWENRTIRRDWLCRRFYTGDRIWIDFHDAAYSQRIYAIGRSRRGGTNE